MRRALAALLALPLLAAADRGDGVPQATPAGEARNCLPLNQIRESRVRSDSVIDFAVRGGRPGRGRGRGPDAYRVTLDRPCPQLGAERRFAYGTSLGQLCAKDIITVLYQTPALQPGASCGLAPFQPVTLAGNVR